MPRLHMSKSRRLQRSKKTKKVKRSKGHPKRRLNGGVWTEYVPAYTYLTVTRPAQIAQAESDKLQDDLGWGEFQAPPQIGPGSPTVTDEQLGWDPEAYRHEELKRYYSNKDLHRD